MTVRATAALAAAALIAAVAAASGGQHPANTWTDLAYPFAIVPPALLFAGLAGRVSGTLRTVLSVGAVGWALNAFVVALRSLTDGPGTAHALAASIGWTADWLYVAPDFVVLVGLVLVLPAGRLTGAMRPIAVIVAAGVAVQVLAGLAAPGTMDNSTLANPLAVGVLAPLRHARDWGFVVFGAGGLLAALAVHATRLDARRSIGVGALVAVALAFASTSAGSFGEALLAALPFDLAVGAAAVLAVRWQPRHDLPAASGRGARMEVSA